MLNVSRLYELMDEIGIKNLKELSRETKIAYNTIIYMTNGHDMHVSTLIELSRFFKVPVDYLINTSYGIRVVGLNSEDYVKSSSVLEASFLKML